MGFTSSPFPPRKPADLYDALGLTPEASFRQIEDAYWRLAKDPQARDDIAFLNEAYEVLSHKGRRLAYDREQRERRREEGARDDVGVPRNAAIKGKLWEFAR